MVISKLLGEAYGRSTAHKPLSILYSEEDLTHESWFQVGCTVVATLLHYLFLVVFFTMLAEGVLLIRMVVWPLVASIRIAWKLMIGIWGRYNSHFYANIDFHNLSLVGKPVSGVFDQVRHKPGCTFIEDG